MKATITCAIICLLITVLHVDSTAAKPEEMDERFFLISTKLRCGKCTRRFIVDSYCCHRGARACCDGFHHSHGQFGKHHHGGIGFGGIHVPIIPFVHKPRLHHHTFGVAIQPVVHKPYPQFPGYPRPCNCGVHIKTGTTDAVIYQITPKMQKSNYQPTTKKISNGYASITTTPVQQMSSIYQPTTNQEATSKVYTTTATPTKQTSAFEESTSGRFTTEIATSGEQTSSNYQPATNPSTSGEFTDEPQKTSQEPNVYSSTTIFGGYP